MATEDGSGPSRGRGRAPAALLHSALLAVLALLFLGPVVAFGPDGFGGDGTPTRGERLRADIGAGAGIGAIALTVVVLAAAVLIRPPLRDRVLTVVVACQAAAVLVLIVSALG